MNPLIEKDRASLVGFIKEYDCFGNILQLVAEYEGHGLSQSLLGIGMTHLAYQLIEEGYKATILDRFMETFPEGAFESDVSGNVEHYLEEPAEYAGAAFECADEFLGTPLSAIFALGFWEVLREAKARGCTEKLMEMV